MHEEGIEQGIEQTARNMLRKNFPLDTISEITGLSIDAIKEIEQP